MRYLVTGTGGFIGFHLAIYLLKQGQDVIGIDNFEPYYPIILKKARHSLLKEHENFQEKNLDLCDLPRLEKCFRSSQPQVVCHLAAQPGVRYSLVNPFCYQKNNLEAFVNIIELTRRSGLKKFVYASSSSVYGNEKELPYSEKQTGNTPISLYAATKKANELIAHSYTHLYGMQTTGLRFFTVYGPWGRPDMAIWKFTDAIAHGKAIDVYNEGRSARDFTYIDDIVAGLVSALKREAPNEFEIFNLGNNHSETVMDLISLIEKATDKKAKINLLPPQPGDMDMTFADITKAQTKLGFMPSTSLHQGIEKFSDWYKEHLDLVAEVQRIGCLG